MITKRLLFTVMGASLGVGPDRHSKNIHRTEPVSVKDQVLRITWSKPSTISTPTLEPCSPYTRSPIKRVVCPRSYALDGLGDLILGPVSHLDAFSGYLHRT
jgi:hypothetical protein